MPSNPERSTRGGDVEGQQATDVVLGKPVQVASASYEPGYDISGTLDEGYVSVADLKQGYASYGKAIGEGKR